MFQYRQALVRMRQGDSDREIAAAQVMGRRKAEALREVAIAQGWLAVERALPEDAELKEVVAAPRRAASTAPHMQPPS